IVCPPALRPAVVILLAMLAAKGTSELRSVYVINRGYEYLADRLNALDANIQSFRVIYSRRGPQSTILFASRCGEASGLRSPIAAAPYCQKTSESTTISRHSVTPSREATTIWKPMCTPLATVYCAHPTTTPSSEWPA